jgi:hypothetical protein
MPPQKFVIQVAQICSLVRSDVRKILVYVNEATNRSFPQASPFSPDESGATSARNIKRRCSQDSFLFSKFASLR